MPSKFKKLSIILGLIGAFLFGLSFTSYNKSTTVKSSPTPQIISAKTEATSQSGISSGTVKVTRVIDGDTIEIDGGQRIRLIGIDTPETVDPRQAVACFGKEASHETKSLLEGKSVTLEKDVSETDKYSRLLRYVFLDNLFVNDYLVRQGFAQVSTYPPDVKYQNQLLQAQQEAQNNDRGLWSICQNLQTSTTKSSDQQTGCNIKGNISSSGEKIYHMPGQRYWEKTVIDESKGEHWFCSEDDAVSAGWRKSKV